MTQAATDATRRPLNTLDNYWLKSGPRKCENEKHVDADDAAAADAAPKSGRPT